MLPIAHFTATRATVTCAPLPCCLATSRAVATCAASHSSLCPTLLPRVPLPQIPRALLPHAPCAAAIAAHAASCLGCCRTLLPVLLPTLRALPHATPQPHTRCPAATCCLAACVLHSHRALPCCCALPCCRPRCPLVHRIAVEPRRAAVPTTALRHATALSTAEPLPYFCAVLSLPVPSTHVMTLRPSSSPQLVVPMLPPSSSLPGAPDPESDLAHAASPTLVESSVVYRPDYFMSLVSESDRPPSVRGELALGCDVLKERLFELECLVALVPHLTAMLFAPEGDADALDIPTPCSYAEAITGQYSS
ncbi:unnamed protein product [Closterium sp. NIES-53]